MKKKYVNSNINKCENCKIISSHKTQISQNQRTCCSSLNRSVQYYLNGNTARKKDELVKSFLVSKQNSKSIQSNILDKSTCLDIINENIFLKMQNNKLNCGIQYKKSNLQNQSVYSCNKDNKNCYCNSKNQTILQQKLYNSNKALQQTILQLNQQQKINKVLEQNIESANLIINQYNIQKQLLKQQIQKYRQKVNNYMMRLKKQQRIQQKLKDQIRQNNKYEIQFKQMIIHNKKLQLQIKQLQKQLNDQKQKNNYCLQTLDNIQILQQNYSKINQDQTSKIAANVDKKQIINHFDIIRSCQQYIQNQFNIIIRQNFKNGLNNQQIQDYKQAIYFKDLNKVKEMFSDNDKLYRIIGRLDLSGLVFSLLQGFYNECSNNMQKVIKKIGEKINTYEIRYSNIEKKLGNIYKIIKNKRLRNKTDKLKALIGFNFSANKQNINTLNCDDNSKTLIVKNEKKK